MEKRIGPLLLSLPAAEVASTVSWWVRLNYVRSALGLYALIAAVTALSLPSRLDGVRAERARTRQ